MGQRRHHYEQAFEAYLRARRVPYISVDEARRALLPDNARLRLEASAGIAAADAPAIALKSFDFVVYEPHRSVIVDVKGRKIPVRRSMTPTTPGRLECWVTQEDIDSMRHWRGLFGADFEAAFVFLYWCEAQPPDGLFQEVFAHRGRWYAVRAITLDDYAAHMRARSPRWGTVHLSTADFERLSQPFAPLAVGVARGGVFETEAGEEATRRAKRGPRAGLGALGGGIRERGNSGGVDGE
ncbi:MAG: HYExAFE family protein [Phycisphaerales bacterium]|nr:HYExAFE family protein [Phycisphaerales bacterium]